MNDERLMNIILSPRVSEKTARKADMENQHVFSVAKDAKKLEVKKAIEKMFDVKVDRVRIMNVNGCLLYTSPSPRDATLSRMPSSA